MRPSKFLPPLSRDFASSENDIGFTCGSWFYLLSEWVCMCMRERERERERASTFYDRHWKRERASTFYERQWKRERASTFYERHWKRKRDVNGVNRRNFTVETPFGKSLKGHNHQRALRTVASYSLHPSSSPGTSRHLWTVSRPVLVSWISTPLHAEPVIIDPLYPFICELGKLYFTLV